MRFVADLFSILLISLKNLLIRKIGRVLIFNLISAEKDQSKRARAPDKLIAPEDGDHSVSQSN
ncbi:hypothetical protein W822_00710 [Advenella kashmirensis W13003]|uniref:Uncharacterized protein n=1 Tax=Advenella kashmirensis W13003 TaxID=1424334 RepID=V8QZ87_9BURK|nr:hypothetical protein W822_00710 [Advenella kashmirensis W13003]